MTKRQRQWLGLLSAVAAYYLVHEGAHLLYALFAGAFRGVRFLGLGVQVDIYPERLSELQMGLFCLAGAAATAAGAYALTLAAPALCRARSKVLRACLYYITVALLLLDPLYLSALCGFFGGGDMNGLALLFPEWAVRLFFGAILAVNCLLLWKRVYPAYRRAFSGSKEG